MTEKEAWSALAQLYQSPSRGNIFRLTTIFHSLHQQADQPALSFINQVITAASELKDLGEDISDQKIKYQILGHLAPDYDSLVTTLSTVDTDNSPLTVREIREYILREETTIKQKKLKLSLNKLPSTTTKQKLYPCNLLPSTVLHPQHQKMTLLQSSNDATSVDKTVIPVLTAGINIPHLLPRDGNPT